MNKGAMRARLSYRWEALRYGYLQKRGGLILLFNLIIMFFISSSLILVFERARNPDINSFWDALYFVFISIATVGYGDIVPVTAGGRIVIILSLIFVIGTLSAFITLMATKRVAKAKRRYDGLQETTKSSGHIVVCGWNPRAIYVLKRLKEELESRHMQIILLCDLEDNPVDDEYFFFFRGNPTSMADLERVNVGEAGAVILLADESKGGSNDDVDARTVLAALNIKDINPEVKITAEALEPDNTHHLELAGVGEILDTNLLLGNLIGRSAIHYGLINAVTGVVTREAGTRIYVIETDETMVGRTRGEISDEIPGKYDATLLAVVAGREFRPDDDSYRIAEGDSLLLISEEKPPGARSAD